MTTTRLTLCRWLLAAFLERGCDPWTARVPRRVLSVRLLSPAELAELNPFARPLVSLHNLHLLRTRSPRGGAQALL